MRSFAQVSANAYRRLALTAFGAWRFSAHCNVTGAPILAVLRHRLQITLCRKGNQAIARTRRTAPGNQATRRSRTGQAAGLGSGAHGSRARADAGNRLPAAVVSTPDAGHIGGLIGRLWRTASRPGSARDCPPATRRPTPTGCPSPDAGRLSGRDRPGRSPWGCRPRIDAGPGSTPAAPPAGNRRRKCSLILSCFCARKPDRMRTRWAGDGSGRNWADSRRLAESRVKFPRKFLSTPFFRPVYEEGVRHPQFGIMSLIPRRGCGNYCDRNPPNEAENASQAYHTDSPIVA